MDDIKTAVQSQFAANAENYVASTTHRATADLAQMMQWAALQPTDRVLDIATGGGHTALYFAPYVHEVVATDFTPTMLAAAAQHIADRGVHNIRTELADAEALPYAAESFEVVTCRTAPHHFPNPQQFVREVARVLQPGGRFVLVDNSVPTDHEIDEFINELQKLHDPTHLRAYTIPEWQTMCVAAGLQVVHTEELPKYLDIVDWCDRASVPAERRALIQTMFRETSDKVRDALDLTWTGSVVTRYRLPVAFIVACKGLT